jgi:hypothetical protein
MLTAIPVHADTTLKVHGSDGLKSTIQVRNGKGRMSSDDRREYLLYDSGTGTITYVEPKQQQYTQLTTTELEATVQTVANIKQTMAPYMADMLAMLSAEQRKMIEQRMGAIPGAPSAGNPVRPADIRTVDRGRHAFAGLRCMTEQFELLVVELEGVPVAVRDIEHGKRYQVTAVSNAALSDGLFNGYGKFQKQEISNLFR